MVDYTTMRVPTEDYEKAKASKKDSETWGEFLQRCTEQPPELVETVDAEAVVNRIDDLEVALTTELERMQR